MENGDDLGEGNRRESTGSEVRARVQVAERDRSVRELIEVRKEGKLRNRRDIAGRDTKVGNQGCRMAVAVALATVAVGGAGAALYRIRPRDPIFEVVSINLKGFNLRFCPDSPMLMAVVDVELTLSIKVTNVNIAPIDYTSTIMDVYYRGDLLGQAKVEAGGQGANSSQIIDVPCKLDGLEITNHITDLFSDVAKRQMTLHSVVTISGHANVWKWNHPYEVRTGYRTCELTNDTIRVHVVSDITVDPIFLNIIEQENKVHMQLEPLI